MQHTQFYYVWPRTGAVVTAALLCWGNSALADGMAHATPPDPILDGGSPGPCSDLATGPDYAAGTDALGNPVLPAGVGAPPVPVPDSIAIPIGPAGPAGSGFNPATGGGDRPYVMLDGKKLAPLLNPATCRR